MALQKDKCKLQLAQLQLPTLSTSHCLHLAKEVLFVVSLLRC